MLGKSVIVIVPPSISHVIYFQANALGRNSSTLREFLEKNYVDNMSREDAITLSIKTLLEVVEAGSKNIELAIVQADGELSVRELNHMTDFAESNSAFL